MYFSFLIKEQHNNSDSSSDNELFFGTFTTKDIVAESLVRDL